MERVSVDADIEADARCRIDEIAIGAGTNKWSTAACDIRCQVALIRLGINTKSTR